MAEQREARPPRTALLRAVSEALVELDPPLTALAERVLGLDSRIDLVARDDRGGVVVVTLAAPGEDLSRLTDVLAQRSWLEPRLPDWLQIAPTLPIDPGRRVRALLLAPRFESRTLAAARALGDSSIELSTYRARREVAGWRVEIETVGVPGAGPGEAVLVSPPESLFRTGLDDADLGLAATEGADVDFEPF
jgi:hypothetical protein